MDTFTSIEERRSVKRFDPNHRAPEADIRRILEAALLSPTAFNMQHWRFVVVTDPVVRQRLKEASWGQAQVTDASFLIMVCADCNAHARDPGRYYANAPEAARQKLVGLITGFYGSNEQLCRDEAIRSCGIASQTLMLAAKALGYDTCPMIGFDPEKAAAILNLPPDHLIALMITVGKALEPARPRSGQLPYEEVVFRDRLPE